MSRSFFWFSNTHTEVPTYAADYGHVCRPISYNSLQLTKYTSALVEADRLNRVGVVFFVVGKALGPIFLILTPFLSSAHHFSIPPATHVSLTARYTACRDKKKDLPLVLLPDNPAVITRLFPTLPTFHYQSVKLVELTHNRLPL